jgi:PPK2 family polyphosphate:nucleotide phosphotransferase
MDYRIKPGSKAKLSSMDPGDTAGHNQDEAVREKTRHDLDDLAELQELLYAAQTHAVLVVLQGIDTAGKDGTIEHVFSGVNPQGCRVASFKRPTELELSHDYLWRVHAHCPAKGEIVIFNRSHYESVLVERVHELVPRSVWKGRYQEINEFERLLTRSDTIVVKLFLNLSKGEQKKRLRAREEDPEKRWKCNPADWEERKLWDDYQEAFDEMLRKTSTAEAPWWVVPSDRKWFRNMVVADVITDVLKPYREGWIAAVEARGTRALRTGAS